MYCSICGKHCVIPEGYEGTRGFGVIINKETHETKVIRCVECVNRYGLDKLVFVCSRKELMKFVRLQKAEGVCMICHKTIEVRHVNLYPSGSEGLFCCQNCENKLLEFIREKMRKTVEEKIKNLRKEVINNDRSG